MRAPDGVTVTLPADRADDDAKAATARTIAAFLSLARSRFETVRNAEAKLRENMMEDYRFRAGDQWDQASLAEREQDDRASLTINRLPQFIRQVTNAQRAANLAVKVLPVDSGADIKTAEVLQGLIRHIEQQSDASVAYSTAGDHQATMGRGYWRVDTEYEHDRSFVQDVRIRRIRNPFTVFMDPSAMEADGSDAGYALIVEDVPKDEYDIRFPTSKAVDASLEDFVNIGGSYQDWMPTGKIKIATYFYVEQVKTQIHLIRFTPPLMPAGAGTLGEPPKPTPQDLVLLDEELSTLPADLTYTTVKSRTVLTRKVKQALINAIEVLEGNDELTEGRDWPGRWIPIVPVIGDELDINGEIDLRGMVRDARDPQRLYNYQNSTLAETLALVPRTPWIGYEGQFEGHEVKWGQANRRAFPYLEVKAVSIDGKPAPLPQRTSVGADVGAIMTAIQQSDNDLKATMGLYEPSLGVRQSSSQSGKAIQALQKAGENANSNFLDNMSRAIRFTGRLIIDLIPKIYDAPRIVRIIGTDEQERQVVVHAGAGVSPESQLPEGIKGVFDVGVGRFDVAVSTGPSLETKRREAFEALNEFVQAYPAAFPVVGDLLVGSLDWPGSQAAAGRLKKLVPPEAMSDDEAGDQPPIPPQVQAQMAQMTQQLEALGGELQQAKQIIGTKQAEAQAQADIDREQIASNERIQARKAQVELIKLEATLDAEASRLRAEAEIAHIEQRLDHAHERGMALVEQSHAQENADIERTHALVTQARTDARDDARAVRDRVAAAPTAPASASPELAAPPTPAPPMPPVEPFE